MNLPRQWPLLFFAPQGLLLAYFLWRTAFPASFLIGNDTSVTYQKKGGKIAILKVDRSATGVVKIPPHIGSHPVTAIRTRAFFQCDQINRVILPPQITQLGPHTFHGCTNLAQLVFQGNAPNIGPSFRLPPQVQVVIQTNATGFGDTFGGRPVNVVE